MPHPSETHLVKKLLERAKIIAPSRCPRPEPGTELEFCQIWADTLRIHRYPPELWADALTTWAMNPDGGFLDVAALNRHATAAAARWRRDPDRKALLDAQTRQRLLEREARGELPPGTADSHPTDQPLSKEQQRQLYTQLAKQLRKPQKDP